MSTTLALYQIESTLQSLFEVRDQAEVDGDSEALKVIDSQIDDYVSQEVKKVDSICAVIRICEERAEFARAEAQRIHDHAKAWEARRDRIKASALRAMQTFGVRVLETPTNKLRVQNNGGLQTLETDTYKLPRDYQLAETVVPLDLWVEFTRLLVEHERTVPRPMAIVPNTQVIREALKRGEVVPGAFLKERGVHLRVE